MFSLSFYPDNRPAGVRAITHHLLHFIESRVRVTHFTTVGSSTLYLLQVNPLAYQLAGPGQAGQHLLDGDDHRHYLSTTSDFFHFNDI